jgi:hypothetical protein
MPAEVAEDSLKAAFIYKFLGYADWPANSFKDASMPIIGVLGADGIAGDLAQIVPWP